MSNEVLLAMPFFTFMGLILERSGMAEDLLDTIGQLFGPVRGGLAFAVIFVGALLAATTGVVAASVISMGLISLPIMLRYGYDRRLASGVIAASGTLAQIIPPSLVLIVMADQLGRSVGDMYEGAFLPGIILAGLYAAYVALMAIVFPKSAPGLPREAIGFREPNGSRGVWQLGILVLFSGPRRLLRSVADRHQGRRGFRHPDHLRGDRCGAHLRPHGLACSGARRSPLGGLVAALVASTSGYRLGYGTLALDGDDHRRRALRAGRRPGRELHGLPADVADGAAGHLRDGAAAAADLPRARHDLHRPRDADGGRRHGRARLTDPRRHQAPARQQPEPLQLQSSGRPRRRRPSSRPSCSSS